MSLILDNLEYDKLIKRLEFFDTTRNNLLTFSFTAVLAVLGIALEVDMDVYSSWLCLLPFGLIVPFSARISYYRLASAHISSFLRTFAKEKMKFEIGAQTVPENCGRMYGTISWLVNHEMVLLGLVCCAVFWYKYYNCIGEWHIINYIAMTIPIFLLAWVYLISDATFNFSRMICDFSRKWNDLYDGNPYTNIP